MSAGKNIWTVVKDSPPWAKGILVLGVGAAAYFAGLSIYRNIKKKNELKDANKAGVEADQELKNLSNQGINPTLPDSAFEVMCQSLVQAMNGCGTDEQMVYDQFSKLANAADVRKLISQFGVRYYEPCAVSQPISYAKWLWDSNSFGGGLPTWLSYDLSTSEIDKINTILQGKSIDYKF